MYKPVYKNAGVKRSCVVCSKTYEVGQKNQKYCSTECYNKNNGIRRNGRAQFRLSSGTSGALSELLTCADLLKRGFAVFRSVSQSADCDLIALKATHCVRIEVRTGYRTKTGHLTYLYKSSDRGKSDVVAVVLPDSIEYVPDLDSTDVGSK